MGSRAWVVVTLLVVVAGCAPVQRRVSDDGRIRTTRTYFLGIPVATEKAWSEGDLPPAQRERLQREGSAAEERLRQFEEETLRLRQGTPPDAK